jgi:hypothetical protein
MSIPVAPRSKALVCVRSLARTAGSNTAGGMNVSLLSVVCCQLQVSSSGWSPVQRSPTDCGVSECDREASIMKKPWSIKGCCKTGRRKLFPYFALWHSANDKVVTYRIRHVFIWHFSLAMTSGITGWTLSIIPWMTLYIGEIAIWFHCNICFAIAWGEGWDKVFTKPPTGNYTKPVTNKSTTGALPSIQDQTGAILQWYLAPFSRICTYILRWR